MIQLSAGQNMALSSPVIRCSASAPVELSALVTGPDLRVRSGADVLTGEQRAAPGIRVADTDITVTPSEVDGAAHAVLLLASASPEQQRPLGALRVELADTTAVFATFDIAPISGERALICFEVYRRGDGWKVRALGQGYAGGMPELLAAHGVTAPVAAEPVPTEPASAPGAPWEVPHGLERLWLIFEDAARSAAAWTSARDYAAHRLDQELSTALADPTARNTPAVDAARAAAQVRHDELHRAADRDFQRDSNQLRAEIAEADALVSPALASWESPVWDQEPVAGDGIRLGELYAPERGDLRVPYCVPAPLTHPLWLLTESSAAAAPVVGALVARLVAAGGHGAAAADVIDLTRSLTPLTDLLQPVLAQPQVTDHTQIGLRLHALTHAADLAEMAHRGGVSADVLPAAPPPPIPSPEESRILVVTDFPHGFSEDDLRQLVALLVRGELLGLSTIIVGAPVSPSDNPLLIALANLCQQLPIDQAAPMLDPWTQHPWRCDLDVLPTDPQQRRRVLQRAGPYRAEC